MAARLRPGQGLSIPMQGRTDGRGRRYLFAALPALDLVLFVYEFERPDGAGNDHELVLKPYQPKESVNGSERPQRPDRGATPHPGALPERPPR